jgi:pectate lyase
MHDAAQRAAFDALDAGAPDASDASDASDDVGSSAPEGFSLPGLVGWAAQPGSGVATTIGGAVGRVVTANTAEQLEAFAQSDEPLVIRICGTLRSPNVRVSSNKTLVGVGTNPTLEGGLAIRGTTDAFVSNVVVKNLRINASSSSIEGVGVMVDKAHHVWLDHGDLFDAAGGLLHVVHGADFVSVSWTLFHFTAETPDQEHRFACMIGNSDEDQAEDTGHLRVTLHHNWWADYIRQRAPRVRFGDVHLFNNFYSTAGNDYSIWAALGSRVLLENNYFRAVTNPHELHDPDAQLLSIGNVYDGATGSMQSTGSAFVPPYVYEAEPAVGLRPIVQAGAGVK